ncbi:MAG: methyltransferase [Aigarchaeota archaeon]|nr:methyltransferase [Aigarchaeota archaeon]MDW8092606.1 methyltransferase [Nitrososphaerota archaeon]
MSTSEGRTVYPPSDDTWLLEDSLRVADLRGKRVAEIGFGSGYVTSLLSERADEVIATDLSEEAALHARRSLGSKAEGVHLIVTPELSCIRSGVRLDLIVSNPPYLPDEGLWDLSIEGGPTGIETCIRVIEESRRFECDSVVVVSSLSDLPGMYRYLESIGHRASVISKRHLFFEELMVLLISPGSSDSGPKDLEGFCDTPVLRAQPEREDQVR